MLLWPVFVLLAATPDFNRDIRPILSDRCFSCHGPDPGQRKANLRLDTEAGAKSRAILPADPARSPLLQRVTSTNQTLRMPPAYLGHAPLTTTEIDTLRQWIAGGAPWQQHWSFIPPRKAATPAGIHPIDHFVRTRLDREGLKPSPPAAAHALIRRAALDLTGLPPSASDLDAPYAEVLDRLLASPRTAERLAYRWMEAARYADTNGYQSDGVRSMWRWRDWVIDAFARNMPFDQFTIEQLAGDLLPSATTGQKVATGFLRNHRTSAEGGIIDEEFRVEYVADRAETVSTVWLGLTTGCARCHDHKYDPITQRDFYRLFAYFNNVPEKGFVFNFGNEEPYIQAPLPDQTARLAELTTRAADAERRWLALAPNLRWTTPPTDQQWIPSRGLILNRTPENPAFDANRADVVANSEKLAQFNFTDPFTFAARINSSSPTGAIITKSEDYFEGTGHGLYLIDGKLRLHIVFRWTDLGMRVETVDPLPLNTWLDVAATYDGKRKPAGVHLYVNGVEQKLKVLFNELSWPISSKEPIRIGAGGGKRFSGQIPSAQIYDRALAPNEIAALADHRPLAQLPADSDKLRIAYLDLAAPPETRAAHAAMLSTAAERDKFSASIPTVMVMQEGPPRQAYILKRGAYDQHGDPVSPGVPHFLPQPSTPATDRLALARWLVSRDNPLTARVTVNRLWQMLFGTGLVKTVEDFGSQGEWPIHADLLDWLAVDFMDHGWDLRHLLRTILTSETYRQSSRVTPDLLARDPDNRLLARAPRLRLSADLIRDQALAVSGLLVEKTGGPSVKPYQPAGLWSELAGGTNYKPDTGDALYRRSLYTYWRRTIAPPSMVTFDSPTRESCTVRETRTNTPLQALGLMNDPTYLEAARQLATRALRAEKKPDARIAYLYRAVLARDPSPRERAALTTMLARVKPKSEFLAQGDAPRDKTLNAGDLARWTAAASLILNLDEAITKE